MSELTTDSIQIRMQIANFLIFDQLYKHPCKFNSLAIVVLVIIDLFPFMISWISKLLT